jgi:Zn-dependent protease with chaperone function
MKSIALTIWALTFAQILTSQVSALQLDQMASYILMRNGLQIQGQIVVDPYRASGVAATIGGSWNSIIYVDPNKLNTLSPNTWAFIIGHELAHIHLGHTMGMNQSVQNEFDADRWGAMWAYRAGYNVESFLQYMATEPDICTPSHGCWHDRIRNIKNMFGVPYFQYCR